MFTVNYKTEEQCDKDMFSAMSRGEKPEIIKGIVDLKTFVVALNANPFMARLFMQAQKRRWVVDEVEEEYRYADTLDTFVVGWIRNQT